MRVRVRTSHKLNIINKAMNITKARVAGNGEHETELLEISALHKVEASPQTKEIPSCT
jgi:hypothetical protein